MKFKGFLIEKVKITLQYHDELNPIIWNGSNLKSDARIRFTNIAFEFAKFAKIPVDRIKDIIFTGSTCAYNYTKFSDIDIHLIIDEHDMSSDELYDAKMAWQDKHKRLKYFGYPLEFYAQDVDAKLPKDQGQYSLLQDKWLVVPQHLDHVDILKDPWFNKKVCYYIHYIKDLLKRPDATQDIKILKHKFYEMRSAGLAKAGEFSYENALYKEIRNRNLIKSLNSYKESSQ